MRLTLEAIKAIKDEVWKMEGTELAKASRLDLVLTMIKTNPEPAENIQTFVVPTIGIMLIRSGLSGSWSWDVKEDGY